MIDNYEQAQALIKKMEAYLPLMVYPSEQLLKKFQAEGDDLVANQSLNITELVYSGDAGGILCSIESNLESKQNYVVSITHLRIPDDHPLATEIESYQKQRIIRLAISDGKRGKALRMAKKNRKHKGFG